MSHSSLWDVDNTPTEDFHEWEESGLYEPDEDEVEEDDCYS